MTVFGDDGPDDAYTAGSRPDPEQVARRLHEVQRFLRRGRLPEWGRLRAADRDVAIALAADLIAWLAREGSFGVEET